MKEDGQNRKQIEWFHLDEEPRKDKCGCSKPGLELLQSKEREKWGVITVEFVGFQRTDKIFQMR